MSELIFNLKSFYSNFTLPDKNLHGKHLAAFLLSIETIIAKADDSYGAYGFTPGFNEILLPAARHVRNKFKTDYANGITLNEFGALIDQSSRGRIQSIHKDIEHHSALPEKASQEFSLGVGKMGVRGVFNEWTAKQNGSITSLAASAFLFETRINLPKEFAKILDTSGGKSQLLFNIRNAAQLNHLFSRKVTGYNREEAKYVRLAIDLNITKFLAAYLGSEFSSACDKALDDTLDNEAVFGAKPKTQLSSGELVDYDAEKLLNAFKLEFNRNLGRVKTMTFNTTKKTTLSQTSSPLL